MNPEQSSQTLKYLQQCLLMRNVLPRNRSFQSAGAFVQHGHNSEKVSVKDWYATLGSPLAYEAVLDESGRFQPLQISKDIDWPTISLHDFRQHLGSLLRQTYELVDKSLLEGHNGSFNSHNLDDHVVFVEQRAALLLDQLDTLYQPAFSRRNTLELYGHSINLDEERRVLLIASYLHDLGNFYSRSAHPLVSIRMASDLLGSMLASLSPATQRKIRFAIKFHDEKIASYVLSHFENLSNDGSRSKFVERYGIAPLLLLASDKADAVARRRAPLTDAASADSVLADNQSVLAAMVQDAGDHQLYGNELLTRTITISPTLDTKDHNVAQPFRRGSRLRMTMTVRKEQDTLVLPQHFIDNHDEKGIPHFLTWLTEYLAIHHQRMVLESTAVFAAHPKLQWFEIKIVELDNRFSVSERDQGLSVTLRLNRATFTHDLRDIRDALLGKHEGISHQPFLDELVTQGRDWITAPPETPFYFELVRESTGAVLVRVEHRPFETLGQDLRYRRQLFQQKKERSKGL